MKILLIEWEAFGMEDIKEAFLSEGHEVSAYPFSKYSNAVDDLKEDERFRQAVRREVPDVVFSFDYYPVFSRVCLQEKLCYIAWVYDDPQIMLYSDTAANPCNTIYVFDKKVCARFRDAGVKTMRYMPLAANTERLDHMFSEKQPYRYNVSFVGSLYTEELSWFEQANARLPEYARGYIDSLICAQRKIQGYNFIEETLEPVIEDLSRALPVNFGPENRAGREYFYAHYVINRKITSLERMDLLGTVGRQHRVDLFTLVKDFRLPGVCNHGATDPAAGAPFVYRQSRINLNITLRSIESGIPLRAFDIMGAGGFLLSNFQADFLDYFIPDEDFVYYEDTGDLLQKVEYYLTHEKEREAIANNGHDKVAAGHTYRHRVQEMLAELPAV